MQPGRKAKWVGVSLLLAALCVLLVTMLPVHKALWAQSKGFNVQGKASAGGERRVALVIGNAAYDMAPLRNPVNDARAMAATLRTLGFAVTALQLIRYMRTPGLKVEAVFQRVRIDVEKSSGGKQVPWESSSLKGDFYFSESPVEAALPTPPSSPAKLGGPARTIDEEEALWKVIESSTNPVDFEEYLAAFPAGRFVVAARVKLRQLRREEAPRSSAVVVRTGNYRVKGTNPNGSAYQGTLTIERSGALYLVRWKIGKDTYEGQGTLNGSTLTVDWGQPDPVIYQVLHDGTLEGTWAQGRGKGSLVPEQ
jgi:Caspase domain